jgi:hypothetical protein
VELAALVARLASQARAVPLESLQPLALELGLALGQLNLAQAVVAAAAEAPSRIRRQ